MKKTTVKTIEWTKQFSKVALKEKEMKQLKGGDDIVIEDVVIF